MVSSFFINSIGGFLHKKCMMIYQSVPHLSDCSMKCSFLYVVILTMLLLLLLCSTVDSVLMGEVL